MGDTNITNIFRWIFTINLLLEQVLSLFCVYVSFCKVCVNFIAHVHACVCVTFAVVCVNVCKISIWLVHLATCDYDTCRGKSSGKRYLSMCRPENNYYTCNGGEPVFDSCGWDECIDEFGQCGEFPVCLQRHAGLLWFHLQDMTFRVAYVLVRQ